ncbi:MAG TPA: chemotaxis protein CheW [Terriglobales bacterium]|nr:chemotaxis protein CheW [Terriglobales bacterium]
MSIFNERRSYILFPMGKKRFALPAEQVSELARPRGQAQEQMQSFPHTTPLLTGVILRRNQIVPVADVAPLLVGPDAPERKFYLVIEREVQGRSARIAIPVTGECELAEATQQPGTGKLPEYICGLLSLSDEIIEVLDIERLMPMEAQA